MAVTQNELITALQTLLSTNPVRLAMRSGLASELDLADLLVGEIAVATDTLQVWVCTALGTCIQITGGLTALGYYATSGDLSTAHPTGTAGDIYIVGSAPSHLYTWGESAWVDLGAYNDTSAFAVDSSVVHLSGAETITGLKSVPTPTSATHIANKAYVDSDWTPISETWTYASASTITVPTGATTKYAIGTRIKITQTTVKYFVVMAVTDTLLTVYGGTDYTLVNDAISSIFYSNKKCPIGFSLDPTKWEIKTTFTAAFNSSVIGSWVVAYTSPTIPIGGWIFSYNMTVAPYRLTSGSLDQEVTLSNTSAELSKDLTKVVSMTGTDIQFSVHAEKFIYQTTAQTWKILSKCSASGIAAMRFLPSTFGGEYSITARCAYI